MQNVSEIVVNTNGDRHRRMLDLGVCAFVFVFAILLYANTFHHGWVLDDSFLFKDNKFVTAGKYLFRHPGVPGTLLKWHRDGFR